MNTSGTAHTHGIAAACFALLACIASPATAQQQIRGTVIDDSTLLPVPEVLLTLIHESGGEISRTARSDSLGRFTLNVPYPGRFRINAQRIGYVAVRTPPMLVNANEAASVELRMSRNVQLLAPLAIVARPTLIASPLDGFEWRRSRGMGGTYLTREHFEKHHVPNVLAAFTMVPGLRVVDVGDSERQLSNIESGRRVRWEGPCNPTVWLNGTLVLEIKDRGYPPPIQYVSDIVDIDQVYGIEIYKGAATAPEPYSGTTAACGVILIWTRRGGS